MSKYFNFYYVIDARPYVYSSTVSHARTGDSQEVTAEPGLEERVER